jgi:hypothetical protein
VTDTQLSYLQAAAILKAWDSNNRALLRRALATAADESAGDATLSPADTGEGERREILSAIASAILESGHLDSAASYMPLLAHLAAFPPAHSGFAYRC